MLKQHTKQHVTASKKAKVHSSAAAKGWNGLRPENIAKAKKLLKNSSYPSGKILNSIAKLMARHLTP
jgi:hypothetical protein